MRTITICILIVLLTSACKISSVGPDTSNSDTGSGVVTTKNTIEVILTKKISISENDYPGNISFNGNNLILPIRHSYSFPNDQVTSQYYSTDLNFIGNSISTFTGINTANGHFTYLTTSSNIGISTMFWGKTSAYTSDYLSLRDDSTGNVLSTTGINFQAFGCSTSFSHGDPIAFCNGQYYGVCVTSSRLMRLFTFGFSGTLQSAVNTKINLPSDYDKFTAITCIDNSNIIIGRSSELMKFDLNFNLLEDISDNSIGSVSGLTFDGNYFYIQSSVTGYGTQTNFTIKKLNILF